MRKLQRLRKSKEFTASDSVQCPLCHRIVHKTQKRTSYQNLGTHMFGHFNPLNQITEVKDDNDNVIARKIKCHSCLKLLDVDSQFGPMYSSAPDQQIMFREGINHRCLECALITRYVYYFLYHIYLGHVSMQLIL